MLFEKIVSKGIASNSYIIAGENEAAVIDPRRDIDVYTNYTQLNDIKIKAIFDTHKNEDFVNGSLELANATGAEIFHGQNLNFSYGSPVKEKDFFTIDDMILEVIETPGHTPESISIKLSLENNPEQPYMV
ncbi:MAG: MBL fold metallo-hydrolase, partial [Candidatus Thorarchaeota archaeon]